MAKKRAKKVRHARMPGRKAMGRGVEILTEALKKHQANIRKDEDTTRVELVNGKSSAPNEFAENARVIEVLREEIKTRELSVAEAQARLDSELARLTYARSNLTVAMRELTRKMKMFLEG